MIRQGIHSQYNLCLILLQCYQTDYTGYTDLKGCIHHYQSIRCIISHNHDWFNVWVESEHGQLTSGIFSITNQNQPLWRNKTVMPVHKWSLLKAMSDSINM